MYVYIFLKIIYILSCNLNLYIILIYSKHSSYQDNYKASVNLFEWPIYTQASSTNWELFQATFFRLERRRSTGNGAEEEFKI